MESYIESLLLGFIQGLTEFLPISSSAHLAVLPDILRIKAVFLNSNSFAVIMHAGTLIAVILYFRKKIWRMTVSFFRGIKVKEERSSVEFRTGLFIIVATVPAIIAGLFFGGFISDTFREYNMCIAAILIIFGLVLYAADRTGKKNKSVENMNIADALLIGVFQAAALFPGVSRSGITITAALLKGFKREEAAEFSFLLSVPAILAAVVYEGRVIVKTGVDFNAGVVAAGFIAAFLSGLLAIKFLLTFVKNHSFLTFAVYRAVFGGLIIVFAAAGML